MIFMVSRFFFTEHFFTFRGTQFARRCSRASNLQTGWHTHLYVFSTWHFNCK